MYTLELCVKDLDDRLIGAMKSIGCDCDYGMVMSPKRDRIMFESYRGYRFTELIDRLSRVCNAYGVNYVSLLN